MLDEMVKEMNAIMAQATDDADKVMKGNKAAQTRLRTGMQNLKKKAQEVRNEVTKIRNTK